MRVGFGKARCGIMSALRASMLHRQFVKALKEGARRGHRAILDCGPADDDTNGRHRCRSKPIRPRGRSGSALVELISFSPMKPNQDGGHKQRFLFDDCSRCQIFGRSEAFVGPMQLPRNILNPIRCCVNPGEQLPKDASSGSDDGRYFGPHADLRFGRPFAVVFQFCFCIPEPRFSVSGRISFIFGSALFSVVVFRHLPELGRRNRHPSGRRTRNDLRGVPVRAVLRRVLKLDTARPGV